jgi:hypothetical protein
VQHEEKLKITKKNLLGAYGGDEEAENAYFGIYEDEIYYPDADVWEKYHLNCDTIICTQESGDKVKLLILKLTSDSLVIKNLDMDMILRLNRRGE